MGLDRSVLSCGGCRASLHQQEDLPKARTSLAGQECGCLMVSLGEDEVGWFSRQGLHEAEEVSVVGGDTFPDLDLPQLDHILK